MLSCRDRCDTGLERGSVSLRRDNRNLVSSMLDAMGVSPWRMSLMGSGTTGIACINTGRDFIGIEKETEYFDLASERLKNLTEEREVP